MHSPLAPAEFFFSSVWCCCRSMGLDSGPAVAAGEREVAASSSTHVPPDCSPTASIVTEDEEKCEAELVGVGCACCRAAAVQCCPEAADGAGGGLGGCVDMEDGEKGEELRLAALAWSLKRRYCSCSSAVWLLTCLRRELGSV